MGNVIIANVKPNSLKMTCLQFSGKKRLLANVIIVARQHPFACAAAPSPFSSSSTEQAWYIKEMCSVGKGIRTQEQRA